MLGINYDVVEYFYYQNKQLLQKELYFNNIGICEFMPNENWIKYKINLKKCIRLRDLIYYIEQELVYFTIGQILRLCEQLIQKVIDMSQNQIDHLYLISNRIWLVLDNSSEFLTIYNSNLQYRISFTGFQCPIFETAEQQQSSSISILKIVDQIIQAQLISMKTLEGWEYWNNLIFLPILNQKTIDSKMKIIKVNTSKYKKDQYYKQYQQVFKCLFEKRKKINSSTQQVLGQIKSDYEQKFDGFIMSFLIFEIIPILAQCITKNNFQQIQNYFHGQQFEKIEKYQKNLIKELLKEETLKFMKEEFLQIQQFLKYEISPEEELILVDEIQEEIGSNLNYLTKYFFNTTWTWVDDQDKCKNQFKLLITEMLKQLVQERVMLKIKECILLLGKELI